MRRKNEPATANSEMIAPAKNAARMPPACAASTPAPPAARAVPCSVSTAMRRAVPAAPPTCWMVPRMALPCE